MARQVVGEDELLDLANKGYPKDASEGKKRNKEEGELFYRQTAMKHKVCIVSCGQTLFMQVLIDERL